MKNILNKIGISRRSEGVVVNGVVKEIEIISYDLVSDTGLPIDFSDTSELLLRIQKEVKRQDLIEDRKKKINNINKKL